MPYPHTIRLRGPWQFSVLVRAAEHFTERVSAPIASHGRVNLPADWGNTLGANFRGQVRYTRHFNRPTGLDPHEQVWCVIEGIDPAGNVALNGQALGRVAGYALPASFNVTSLVQDRNELTLDVEMPALLENPTPRPGREHLPGGPIGEVRLEIRVGHFLDGLSVYAVDCADGPELHVLGRIVGEASLSPLAVVVNVCEREILFGEFLPGQEFYLHAAAADLPYREPGDTECTLAPVEIRLLTGGTSVWQTARETAVERVAWKATERQITIADQPVVFPPPTLPATALVPYHQFLTELRKNPTAVWGSRQILSESWYSALDRHNLRVVQSMPSAWAAEVCPRLAYHPSIVAWAAGTGDGDEPSCEIAGQGLFGRPWLKAEEVFESP